MEQFNPTGTFEFKVDGTSGKARATTMNLGHGKVETPVFMPVGTRASVKAMDQADLEEIGAQIILGNTYHLYLRPGHELIEEVGGGLHGFMSWQKPILTDSGGFQIFSLSDLNKVSEEGVVFRSHLDGSAHLIGPEKSMQIQRALGPDVVMIFDECPALPSTEKKLRESMELTLRWARRCLSVELKPYQNLFAIIQGGLDLNLRQECLERLKEMADFPGYAIGGLSVGEKNAEMVELLEQFVQQMPSDKPRYLMGVGTPLDMLNAIKSGVDMFDCVLPTRNARNGQVLTWDGPLNIKREIFKKDTSPLDPSCPCRVCQRYTKAYVRHLYTVGEYLAGQLITYHNLYFFQHLMREARKAILEKRFDEFYAQSYNRYQINTKN